MAETSGFATDLQQSAYLGATVRRAISAAQQRSHRYVTLEHLLFALMDDPDAFSLLEGLRVDIAAIKASIADTVNRNLATLYTPGEFDLRASYKVERVLQTASDDARRLNCIEVDGSFVLAALAREIDSPAADIVKHNGLGFTNAMTWLYGNRGAKVASRPASAAPAKPPPMARETVPQPAQAPERSTFGTPVAEAEDTDAADDELELEIVQENERRQSGFRSQSAPRSQKADLPRQTPPSAGENDEDYGMVATPRRHGPGIPSAPPMAREEAPPQPVRRPPPGMSAKPMPRRPEQGPPLILTRGKEGAPVPAPAPPKRDAPPARGADEQSSLRPQAKSEGGGATDNGTGGSSAEPKLPPSSRLDEMRLRGGGSAPQTPVTTPPTPPPASKAARKRAPAVADARQASKRAGQRRSQRTGDIRAGKLVENIPRRMRTAATERVEVRIAPEDTDALTKGIDGRGEPIRHDLLVTSAMSVMLRAPDGGFTIEPLSPETQWVFDGPDTNTGGEAFGRWRWAVTPTGRGQRRLQVVVAARSVDANGMVGDMALPEQVITVRVRANIWRNLKLGLEWLIVMALGGAIPEAVAAALRVFGE